MKAFFLPSIISIVIFSLFLAIQGCKKSTPAEEEKPEKNFYSKGTLADLAYNPVRQDGTIDSSYLPILKWDEDVFDFGSIQQGEVVEKKYTFKNIGTAPMVILNATSTCGCTIPEWPKTHILPDSTGTILVKFNSANKEGPQNKEVTIFANTIPNHSKIIIKGIVEKTN